MKSYRDENGYHLTDMTVEEVMSLFELLGDSVDDTLDSGYELSEGDQAVWDGVCDLYTEARHRYFR